MIAQILAHTPIQVWILLCVLIALGWSQTRNRQLSLKRVAILPVIMTAFSLWSMTRTFGWHLQALMLWSLGSLAMVACVQRFRLGQGTFFDRQTQQFQVQGSYLPLLLILGIFLTKYSIAVISATQPTSLQNPNFMFVCATLLGTMSGVFLGRSLRLWRLIPTATAPVQVNA